MLILPPSEAAEGVRPSRPIALVVGVLIFADVISAFESTMMLSALPRIIGEFRVSAVDASWTLTAFAMVAATSAAVCGRLGDIYGRRTLLILLLLGSAVGSVVSLSTGTLSGVIVGRAIQGVSGGILPLCFGIVRETVPKHRVSVAVAMVASAAMLAGASGTIVSGVLIDSFGWHYIFVFAAGVAFLAAACALLLPRSTMTVGAVRVDWPGALLFAPAITLCLLGVTNAARWTWGDARTLGSIAAGVAVFALWGWREVRIESPLINVRLFRDRKQGLALLANCLLSAGVFGSTGLAMQLMMQSPTNAPVGLGMSATAAGTAVFCISIIGFLLSPFSGRLSARFGARLPLAIGSAVGVGSAVALALLHDTVAQMVCAVIVLNVALVFMLTSLPNFVVEGVAPEHTSEVTGVHAVARTAFSGVGSAVATLLLSLSVVSGTQFSTEHAYNNVFLLVGGTSAVGLLIALFIRGRGGENPSRRAAPVSALAAEASE
ncbi:MFS transporter [Streptomyces sp. NPDC056656]|uniref:MFS transporter n=1 Tax=Streptomyces sp. NPDC056656 TaxID=3345895 RepID=UPI0036AA8010